MSKLLNSRGNNKIPNLTFWILMPVVIFLSSLAWRLRSQLDHEHWND